MSAQDHKQALSPSFQLGAYRLVRVLGVGGFGMTYLCEHGGLGVQVAVKEYLPNEIAVRDGTEVHPKSAGDREGFEWGLNRFLDEARTLARFEHPNVVRVRDCFEANNTAYIVMDYEDGEPLDTLLRRHGTLTEAQLTRVLLPVAEGLRQVHAAGFLHRDIKPSNIFVRRSDESPVLLDFGAARQALGGVSMTAIFSAGYSPPEQYERNGAHGAWTDIYALSALCYRAITGDAPVEATRRQSQLLRTQTDPLPRLAEMPVASYSSAFLEAVDWGLRLIENERPQSLGKWLSRMQRTATPLHSRPAESKQARQRILSATSHRHDGDEGSASAVRKDADEGFRYEQLGEQYLTGDGVPEDPGQAADYFRKAAMYYRKAADQGDAWSQYNLGCLYDNGSGVPQSADEASLWYRKAAEQGDSQAQFVLGVRYARGYGVPKDVSQATFWYHQAAVRGHSRGQISLSKQYAKGEGVPLDVVQSYAWCALAAARGNERARNLLFGSLIKSMTQAQIADAQRLSRELGDQMLVDDNREHWW